MSHAENTTHNLLQLTRKDAHLFLLVAASVGVLSLNDPDTTKSQLGLSYPHSAKHWIRFDKPSIAVSQFLG